VRVKLGGTQKHDHRPRSAADDVHRLVGAALLRPGFLRQDHAEHRAEAGQLWESGPEGAARFHEPTAGKSYDDGLTEAVAHQEFAGEAFEHSGELHSVKVDAPGGHRKAPEGSGSAQAAFAGSSLSRATGRLSTATSTDRCQVGRCETAFDCRDGASAERCSRGDGLGGSDRPNGGAEREGAPANGSSEAKQAAGGREDGTAAGDLPTLDEIAGPRSQGD